MILGSLAAGVGLIVLGWVSDIVGMFVGDPNMVSGTTVFPFPLHSSHIEVRVADFLCR